MSVGLNTGGNGGAFLRRGKEGEPRSENQEGETRDQIRTFIEGLRGGNSQIADAFLERLTNLKTIRHPDGKVYSLEGEIPVIGRERVEAKTMINFFPDRGRIDIHSQPIDISHPAPTSGCSFAISEVVLGKGPEIIKFISDNGSELIIDPTGFFFVEVKWSKVGSEEPLGWDPWGE